MGATKRDLLFSFAFFFLMTLAVFWPWLGRGLIFTFDGSFPRQFAQPNFPQGNGYLASILYLTNQLVPVDMIQKIIYFLVIFLTGFLASLTLVREKLFLGILAGVIYLFNPFFYDHFSDGHWLFLVGYALFPVLVAFSQQLLRQPVKKNAIILGFLVACVSWFSISFTFIYLTFLGIYFLTGIIVKRETGIIKPFGAVLLTLVVLNLPSIIFLNRSAAYQTLQEFTRADLAIFQSFPDPKLGLVFNLLSLHGYWGESQGRFVLIKELVFFWPVITLGLLFFAALGSYWLLNNKNDLDSRVSTIVLVMIAILSVDLAMGISTPRTKTVFLFLYDHFLPFRGFREPHKFLAGLSLFYALTVPGGVDYFVRSLVSTRLSKLAYLVAVLFFASPTVAYLNGFQHQLEQGQFPRTWIQVDEYLNDQSGQFKVLVFPWHQYLHLSFANKVIRNPTEEFFAREVVASHNYEVLPLYGRDYRVEALHVGGLLRIENEGVNLFGEPVEVDQDWGAALVPINVRYVLLLKEDDWEDYPFLEDQSNLKKIFDFDDLVLYENLVWQET